MNPIELSETNIIKETIRTLYVNNLKSYLLAAGIPAILLFTIPYIFYTYKVPIFYYFSFLIIVPVIFIVATLMTASNIKNHPIYSKIFILCLTKFCRTLIILSPILILSLLIYYFNSLLVVIALSILILVFLVRSSIALPISLLEDKNAFYSLKQSFLLTRGYSFTICVSYITIIVIMLFVAIGVPLVGGMAISLILPNQEVLAFLFMLIIVFAFIYLIFSLSIMNCLIYEKLK